MCSVSHHRWGPGQKIPFLLLREERFFSQTGRRASEWWDAAHKPSKVTVMAGMGCRQHQVYAVWHAATVAEVSTPFHVPTGRWSFMSMLLAHEPLLTKHGPFPCGRYVHGLKVVCPPYPSDQNEWGCVLDVFDFNVHPKKLPEADNTTWSTNPAQRTGIGVGRDTEVDTDHGRADDSSSGTPGSSSSSPSSPPSTRSSTPSSSSTITHEVSHTIHTEPSFVPASDVFVSDVVSKLPYTHTVRKDLCAMYSGFMIDDERIVGLKVGAVLSLFWCSSLGERPLCL